MMEQPVLSLLSRSKRFDIFTGTNTLPAALLEEDLYPPIPLSSDGTVVWGFGVLRQAQLISKEHVVCRSISGGETELLALALALEGRTDAYGWEEKAAIFSLLENCGALDAGSDSSGSVSKIEALVSAKGSFIPHVRKYLALPPVFRTIVEKGVIDLRTAGSISALPEETAVLFLDDTLSLSFSSRRIILQMLYEIFRRDALSSVEITALAKRILSAENPQAQVTALRMPELDRLTSALREVIDRTLGGSGVELKAPPYFEGSAFSVSFSFRSRKELAARIAGLNRLQEHSDDLFSLVR